MVASLMTLQAARHPLALQRRPRAVAEVLASKRVAAVTTSLECAKRVDGAAAVIVVSSEFAAAHGLPASRGESCAQSFWVLGAGPCLWFGVGLGGWISNGIGVRSRLIRHTYLP